MANKYISQLDAADDPNIARDDLVIVRRNGRDYKASITGRLFVPDATAADAGKSLGVSGSYNPEWQRSTGSRDTLFQKDGGQLPSLQVSLLSGKTFTANATLTFGVGYGSDAATTWQYYGAFPAIVGGRFGINLGGSGFLEIYLINNNSFSMTTSDSTTRIHRVVGAAA